MKPSAALPEQDPCEVVLFIKEKSEKGTIVPYDPNEDVRRRGLNRGIYSILAAVLFGAATPFAKILLSEVQPVFLAGLLYLGSGLSLMLVYLVWDRSQNAGPPLVQSDGP
jgi:drug/metabolite transporter (DMT)-like permease